MTIEYSNPQNPTFNIDDDTANSSLSRQALIDAVNADAGITPDLISIDDDGTTATLNFDAEVPTGERSTLDGIINAHDGESTPSVKTVEITGPKDSDGSLILRNKHTKTGWHYEPRSLDFFTSTYKSLYNRKSNNSTIDGGDDYNDASIHFFDSSGSELTYQQTGHESETEAQFQARLDTGCVLTHMDWQPTYDMDIIGGVMMVKDAPASRAYMWTIVAPDIPENLGGSVPHVAGGWNLEFFDSKDKIQIDGRGIKTIAYDPVFNSNKFRTIVKHSAGVKIGVQIIYENFKG